jgi:hypothetical protein
MKSTKLIVLITCSILILIFGCRLMQTDDGGMTLGLGLSDATHKRIEDAGTHMTGVLELLSLFFPALAPVAGAAGAGTLVWSRMKKKEKTYKEPLSFYVKTIEDLKINYPDAWESVKAEIKAQKPSMAIESKVREMRDEVS